LSVLLVEVGHPDSAAMAIREIQSAYPAWRELQGVEFESDVYQKFWNGRTEAESIAYNNAILSAVPWFSGFGSGSTLMRFPRPSSSGK
jgi:hypothetical protein